MEQIVHILNKEVYSDWKIFRMRLFRYLQAGYLLHAVTAGSIVLTLLLGNKTSHLIRDDESFGFVLLFAYLTGYFFTLIFFSQLDARSRFQNYKLIKDKFYEYGFDVRLLRPFVYSRCQRDAIDVAAHDMNFVKEWKELNKKLGFRWYHVWPHLVIRNPRIVLTRDYWSKTLFVKTYHSKYFLW